MTTGSDPRFLLCVVASMALHAALIARIHSGVPAPGAGRVTPTIRVTVARAAPKPIAEAAVPAAGPARAAEDASPSPRITERGRSTPRPGDDPGDDSIEGPGERPGAKSARAGTGPAPGRDAGVAAPVATPPDARVATAPGNHRTVWSDRRSAGAARERGERARGRDAGSDRSRIAARDTSPARARPIPPEPSVAGTEAGPTATAPPPPIPVATRGDATGRGDVTRTARAAEPDSGAVAAASASASREPDLDTAAADTGELLDLLHRAISRYKRYPALARRQGREGTARVAFELTPAGAVEQVVLARSSGFGPLDRAAIDAVERVAPFDPARRALARPHPFEVDVVFELR